MTQIKSEKEFLELVETTAKSNLEANNLSKTVKDAKNDLKEYMLAEDIESAEVGSWAVSCTPMTKTSMDEDKTIQCIQALIDEAEGTEKEVLENLIVMKPTINQDLLEDLIYEGRIDKEALKKAVIETTTYTLRFKKAKKIFRTYFKGYGLVQYITLGA